MALRSFTPRYALLPVWGSLRATGKKVLENRWGLLSVTLKQPGLRQQGWEGCAATASPTASHSGLRCRRMFGSGPQAWIPAKLATQANLCRFMHLMTLLISAGVLGQAKVGAFPLSSFSNSDFSLTRAPPGTQPATQTSHSSP